MTIADNNQCRNDAPGEWATVSVSAVGGPHPASPSSSFWSLSENRSSKSCTLHSSACDAGAPASSAAAACCSTAAQPDPHTPGPSQCPVITALQHRAPFALVCVNRKREVVSADRQRWLGLPDPPHRCQARSCPAHPGPASAVRFVGPPRKRVQPLSLREATIGLRRGGTGRGGSAHRRRSSSGAVVL